MKKMNCFAVVLVMMALVALFLGAPAFGTESFRFNGDSSGAIENEAAGAFRMETAAGKITAEFPFNLTPGSFIFSVPSSGMEIGSINGGSTISMEIFQEGAGWVPCYDSILAEGIYRFTLENQWGSVSFALRGEFLNPPHCIFTFMEVSEQSFSGFFPSFGLPLSPGAGYYIGYVPYLTTTTIDSIARINNTVLVDLEGREWVLQVSGIAFQGKVLPFWRVKNDKTPVFHNQVFGLVMKKKPF